jgi:chromosome segregation ATPase
MGGPDESTNELMHKILANQVIQRREMADIAANQRNVTKEMADIAANQRNVTTEMADIAANQRNVTKEMADITANQRNVTKEMADITANQRNVTTEIALTRGEIADVRTQVAAINDSISSINRDSGSTIEQSVRNSLRDTTGSLYASKMEYHGIRDLVSYFQTDYAFPTDRGLGDESAHRERLIAVKLLVSLRPEKQSNRVYLASGHCHGHVRTIPC